MRCTTACLRLRFCVVGLLCVLSLVAAVASADTSPEADAPVVPPRAAVVSVDVQTDLAPIAPGLAAWLEVALGGAGFEIVPRARVRAAARGRGRAELVAVARRTGADRLIRATLVSVGPPGGSVELRLRAHDAAGELVAAGTGRAIPALLDEASRVALAQLLERLGQRGVSPPPSTAADLYAYGAARAELRDGDLIRAWRLLDGREGRVAERIRQQIKNASQRPEIPLAVRSRIASVSGQAGRGWIELRDAIRRSDDPALLLAGAEAALARDDLAGAARLYRRVTEAAPDSADAWAGRATSHAAFGEFEEAEHAVRRALELAPDRPELHEELAALEAVPAPERAAHLLRAAALRSDRFETARAQELSSSAEQLDPDQAAAAAHRRGLLEARMGRPGEAARALQKAQQLGLEDNGLWQALGEARAASGDHDGAREAFARVIETRPTDAAALAGLGTALAAGADSAAAVPVLEQALDLDPGATDVRRTLARVHVANGDSAAATAVLGNAPAGSDRDQAALLADRAALEAGSGNTDTARSLLEDAVALAPEEPELRRALADAHDVGGEAEEAAAHREWATYFSEASSAGAVQTSRDTAQQTDGVFDRLIGSFPLVDTGTGAPIERVIFLGLGNASGWAGRLRSWTLPRSFDAGAIERSIADAIGMRYPLDRAPAIPGELDQAVSALRDLSRDREQVALVNGVLGSDAVFVASVREVAAPDASPFALRDVELEVRLLGGREAATTLLLANQARIAADGPFTGWNLRALAPLAALLLFGSLWLRRGWGRLEVGLDYDKSAKGFFSIQLSRRSGKVSISSNQDKALQRYARKTSILSRYSRSMVDSLTLFRFLPARGYHVAVHGLIVDPSTQEVIGSHIEERRVRVQRGETARIDFDFRASEAPIHIQLVHGEDTASERVRVALQGDPSSLHYVRGDSTLVRAGNGPQRVIVALSDRILEFGVTIRDLESVHLSLRLFDDDSLVFRDCPDAVEPYLVGDLLSASVALAHAGQDRCASLLRGEHHRRRGETEEAARCFEAAGEIEKAAELSAGGDDTEHTAELFEKAGEFGKAAEIYRDAGDVARAAAAYEAAYEYESAIECYREAADHGKLIELLQKTGAYFEAARASEEVGDDERAIENLQMVEARDADYSDACRRLAELMAARGEHEVAAQKYREVVEGAGAADAPAELLDRYAQCLEEAGHAAEALEVLEALRSRDVTYDVRDRIELLRQQVSAEQAAGPAAAAPAVPEESRYELMEEVGRGGMGVVYKARDKRLGRVVALKRLPENLLQNATAVRLFLREARSAAALNHPNIVTVFDADQEAGNYYITMELLEGAPLDAILKKRKRLSTRDTLRLAIQASRGFQYAHDQRIVHRDIKTSNLFFTRDRVVKIMDFGLAKMIEEVRRASTVIAGTPYYMAPEQAAGEEVDHRADLYAFGVTIFQLLTGRVPFNKGDVSYHHRHTPVPDPRSLAEGIPDELAELILQMLGKTPDERPATTAEVTERLTRILASLGG